MELDTIHEDKSKKNFYKKRNSRKSEIKYYRYRKIGYIKKNC